MIELILTSINLTPVGRLFKFLSPVAFKLNDSRCLNVDRYFPSSAEISPIWVSSRIRFAN